MNFMTYLWVLVGASMLIAYLAQKYIAEKLNIPTVTIFLIFGVIISSFGNHIYNQQIFNHLNFIIDISLGILAFIIGTEVAPSALRKIGSSVIWIAFLEVFITAFFIIWGMIHFTDLPIQTALMLGAIAGVSAPTALSLIMHTHKSKGPIGTRIINIITIDNAISILLFSCITLMVLGVFNSNGKTGMAQIFAQMLLQIGLSALFGIIIGMLFAIIAKYTNREESIFIVLLSMIILLIGLSKFFHISGLMLLMVFGMCSKSMVEKITENTTAELQKIYALLSPIFFILVGTLFSTKYFMASLIIGLVYTSIRACGKYTGTYLAINILGFGQNTAKITGLGLFGQVGLGFGFILLIHSVFGTGKFGNAGLQMSMVVANILIWTCIITETIGTAFAKLSLKLAGELQAKEKPIRDTSGLSRIEERKLVE